MTQRNVYLLLAVVGTIVPWIFFASFFSTEGVGGDFVGALFANGAAGGFTSDLLVSSVVFWIFLLDQKKRRDVDRVWPYVLVNLLIGLSCALPIFLWAREGARARG